MLPRLKNYPTEGAMTLAAGESYVIELGAQSSNFLRVASASASFRIRIDDTYEIAVSAGKKFDTLPNKFSKIEVLNNSGGALTFLLEIGSGSIASDEVVLSGTSNVSDATAQAKIDAVKAAVDLVKTAVDTAASNVAADTTMLQNDRLKRNALTTLAGASYAEVSNGTTVVVSAAANVSGIIIRRGFITSSANINGVAASIKFGTQHILALIGNAVTGGVFAQSIENIFLPAGTSLTITTSGTYATAAIWYEVL